MQLQLYFDDWVEEKAIEIINKAIKEIDNWNGKPFIPVERIASEIFFFDLLPLKKELIGENVAAAIQIFEGGGTIYFRKEDSIEGKRFSIAHEIGHYVCHYLQDKEINIQKVFYHNKCFTPEVTLEYKFKKQAEELSKYNREERAERLKRAHQESEANRFAAELLMPAQLMRIYYEKFNGDIQKLAAEFKVSLTAIRIRVDNLGLRINSVNISESKLIEDLNIQQQKAVKTLRGPVLILAGAGTGKTKVITHRIAYLVGVKKINPRNILAVTFTNKAANEMRERVQALLGGIKYGRNLWIKTFHSFCLAILRREVNNLQYKPNFTIADEDTQKSLIRGICKSFGINEKKNGGIDFVTEIKKFKNNFITVDLIKNHEEIDKELQDVYIEYQRRLMVLNQMDFEDIIVNTIILLRDNPDILEKYQNRFKYILVDEYQDTNYMQFVLLKELSKRYNNICVVGDDDQSIYGWRGASIKNFSRFKEQFGNVKIIPLEQNYRSTKTILAAANSFIAGNSFRLQQKRLWTERSEGDKISFEVFDRDENEAFYAVTEIYDLISNGVDLHQVAILFRTHVQSRLLEKELIRLHIPYQIVKGVPFIDRCEIKDIIAFLHFIFNQNDDESLLRIFEIKTISKGIGKETLKKLKAKAAESQMSIWEIITTQLKNLNISPNIKKNFELFRKLFNEIIQGCADLLPSQIVRLIISKAHYYEHLENTYGKTQEKRDWEDRIEHVEELIRIAEEFEGKEGNIVTLRGFLDQLALYEPENEMDENGNRKEINLMTIHSAKGLEFDYVFLIGLEQGIFPLSRNIDFEEERRLFYVAITRAKTKLYLSCSKFKFDIISREIKSFKSSEFIDEISESLLNN